jgi:hypothetical protein
MILTIDTNRDSPEDIRKAIKALMAILGDGSGFSVGSKNIFDSPSSGSGPSSDAAPGGNVFGNIFGGDSGSEAGSSGESSAPASSDENAEVELY